MSRRSKGPRLYLRTNVVKRGKALPDVWVIRDGQKEVSTGCAPARTAEAEQALAAYIAEKWTPPSEPTDSPGDPACIFVAEVLTLYLREKAPKANDPSTVKARIAALASWWGDKTLADVKRSTSEAYVAYRMTQPIKQATKTEKPRLVTAQGARRELEDLNAAIGYWAGEHPLNRRPRATLPEKPESNRDALTREQAARLLLAAMGWRWTGATWKRQSKAVRVRRMHLRRFILIGLYTGSRPGVIPKILWNESATQAWADPEDGVIYRRGKAERDHKTKRRPLVNMPRRLVAHMRRWQRLDAKEQAARREREGEVEHPFTITTVLHHHGKPIGGRIRRSFASALADAGLEAEITPHWMRHTCATWLMEADVKPWEAAGFTGMTTATLEKHYGHHRPGHQDRAKRALGGRR